MAAAGRDVQLMAPSRAAVRTSRIVVSRRVGRSDFGRATALVTKIVLFERELAWEKPV